MSAAAPVASSSDTIYALSSGAPPAAIAIVRISGPQAAAALTALTGRVPRPRHATRARVRHPVRGDMLDHALALFFDAPATATGEDIAELHLHGGRAVVTSVEDALAGLPGLRRADAGEFTRRAFNNGRLDLAEAEGLADLLAAETEAQRRSALAMAEGALSRHVEGWRLRLLDLAAEVEAAIDFSDEGEVGEDVPEAWRERALRLAADMAALLAQPPVERLKDGVRIVIAGPPNSGKSSLINYLADRDVAIISPVAGTTRDVLEAPVTIQGLPLLLIDTAGLRDTEDAVESIGVDRARAHADSADLLLWLGAAKDCTRSDALRISPKLDLGQSDPDADIAISSFTGAGMDELRSAIAERCRELLPRPDLPNINRRQRDCLSAAHEMIVAAIEERDLLIKADAVRLCRFRFDEITGRAGIDDMLDALFGRFCIGK